MSEIIPPNSAERESFFREEPETKYGSFDLDSMAIQIRQLRESALHNQWTDEQLIRELHNQRERVRQRTKEEDRPIVDIAYDAVTFYTNGLARSRRTMMREKGELVEREPKNLALEDVETRQNLLKLLCRQTANPQIREICQGLRSVWLEILGPTRGKEIYNGILGEVAAAFLFHYSGREVYLPTPTEDAEEKIDLFSRTQQGGTIVCQVKLASQPNLGLHHLSGELPPEADRWTDEERLRLRQFGQRALQKGCKPVIIFLPNPSQYSHIDLEIGEPDEELQDQFERALGKEGL